MASTVLHFCICFRAFQNASFSSVQEKHTLVMPSALLLTCEPIPLVRIALIGLGDRGMKTLRRYAFIPHAEIRYVVDLDSEKTETANAALTQSGRPAAVAFCGAEAWKTVCEKEDVDLVYVCTEWNTHTPMAVYAMEHGKHVAVEVPAATTVEECFRLVRTAEATQRHCFMTENCCYDFFALQTLEMFQKGKLGTITHCEGAYIHRIAEAEQEVKRGESEMFRRHWMAQSYSTHGGNPYPTHGIGPIAQLLGIHRKDRFKTITSVTARGVRRGEEWIGKVNSSLLTTEGGVTILLQLDVTTPRPYSRLQTVCGTKGFVQKYPLPVVEWMEEGGDETCGEVKPFSFSGEEALKVMEEQFSESAASQLWAEGHKKGVPNEMNYVMDRRLIHCLHHGLPLDLDVYDAAEWSCLCELSQISAARGGAPVEIPDFLGE